MSHEIPGSNQIHSIDDYIESLEEWERQEIEVASLAIDLARLLYRARDRRGLTQKEAAQLADLQQQAVSRMERANTNLQVSTLSRYLAALGYDIEIAIKDPTSGELIDSIKFHRAAPA